MGLLGAPLAASLGPLRCPGKLSKGAPGCLKAFLVRLAPSRAASGVGRCGRLCADLVPPEARHGRLGYMGVWNVQRSRCC
eukprot:8832366-Pyramimonas_sp.AAC.1